MGDNYFYQKIPYTEPPVSSSLVKFTVEVEERDQSMYLPDPVSSQQGVSWLLVGNTYRYVYKQEIETSFTDPTSYADAERCPPTAVSSATARAAALSLVDLPASMADYRLSALTAYSKMPVWELIGHTVRLQEPGVYVVTYSLAAQSDLIWDPANFRRTKFQDPRTVPNAASVTKTS